MARVRRRVFNWSAGASLAVFVLGGVLWVWGAVSVTEFVHSSVDAGLQHGLTTGVQWRDGRLLVWWEWIDRVPGGLRFEDTGLRLAPSKWPQRILPVTWWSAGVAHDGPISYHPHVDAPIDSNLIVTVTQEQWEAWVPLWMVMVLAAVLPGWQGWGTYRRWRWRPGTCRVCGYDLRGTPERCPECGTAVASGETVVPGAGRAG